jgi:hypothetical protein
MKYQTPEKIWSLIDKWKIVCLLVNGQGQLYLWFAALDKAQTTTAGTSAFKTDRRPGSLHATGLFNFQLDGKTSTDICLLVRNVEFSTPSVVRMNMRVTEFINLFEYIQIHQEKFQYSNNNIMKFY